MQVHKLLVQFSVYLFVCVLWSNLNLNRYFAFVAIRSSLLFYHKHSHTPITSSQCCCFFNWQNWNGCNLDWNRKCLLHIPCTGTKLQFMGFCFQSIRMRLFYLFFIVVAVVVVSFVDAANKNTQANNCWRCNSLSALYMNNVCGVFSFCFFFLLQLSAKAAKCNYSTGTCELSRTKFELTCWKFYDNVYMPYAFLMPSTSNFHV